MANIKSLKRFLRANWYIIAIVAAVGIFMILATTVIWPAREPIVTNRIGVATLTRDGQTYYCFWLGENQYNNTVFPSERWENGEVVLVPVPNGIDVYMTTINAGNTTVDLDK